MNKQLTYILDLLNVYLIQLNSELSVLNDDLKKTLDLKRTNEDEILKEIIPDNSSSTCDSIKIMFPSIIIPTKKVKIFFSIIDISVEDLREKVRELADKYSYYYEKDNGSLRGWNKYYYSKRFSEGNINIKNQEIDDTKQKISIIERLKKINKNKLTDQTISKLKRELGENMDYFIDNPPIENTFLWVLLLHDDKIKEEISGLEIACDFEPEN